MQRLPLNWSRVTMQFALPKGPPTWPPWVTKRTSSGQASGESCRPPPVTRQPGSGSAGRQQSDRFAVQLPSATILDPVRLMAHALLIAATTAWTRTEFSRLVSTQLVSAIFTAPHGSRSGPMPSSLTVMLHSVASPLLVISTYHVILVAIVPQTGVETWTGVLPLTDTNLWTSIPAWRTLATAFVLAPTAAPLAWTPPHWAVTVAVLVVVSAQFVLRFEIVMVPPTAN